MVRALTLAMSMFKRSHEFPHLTVADLPSILLTTTLPTVASAAHILEFPVKLLTSVRCRVVGEADGVVDRDRGLVRGAHCTWEFHRVKVAVLLSVVSNKWTG